MKKILCVVLVLALAAAAVFAFVQKAEMGKELAEVQTALNNQATVASELEMNAAELQAQLDEATAKLTAMEADTADADRIAELEAAVELYKPFYEAQVAAEYDGGVIFVDDVMEEYAYIESMYSQYGLDLATSGYASEVKKNTVEMLVENAALDVKAAELGLDQIDEETLADLTEEAAANFETYVTAVSSQFATEGATEEEIREGSIAYLETMGYNQDQILEDMIAAYVDEQVYNYITKDVVVTEEDVQAAYDEQVAADQEAYADDYTYNNARNAGTLITWNPEGYRQVKHVLVKFSDEQTTKYNELNTTLDTLNAELEALAAPAEETAEEAAEETTEEAAEEVVVRTEEEINADIAAVQADIDALYAELMPTAEEVIAKFNEGTSFAELIETYNEDPGMQSEPTKTAGYAVAAESTTWDPAFTAGAMSIAEVGGISEPVLGSYGIHIIYYEADVVSGAVALDDVRVDIETAAMDAKLSDVYTAAVNEWTAAINPVYHLERLG